MESVFRWIFFAKIGVQLSVELFFCCSADCLHLHFIVLLCVFGNGMGIGNLNGNGIRVKLGNGNGKE